MPNKNVHTRDGINN